MSLARQLSSINRYGRLLNYQDARLTLARCVPRRDIFILSNADQILSSRTRLDGNVSSFTPGQKSALTFLRTVNTQVLRPYVDPKLSYAFGRSNETLLYTTIGRQLELAAETSPERMAFIFHQEKKSITVKQLNYDVNKLAKALLTKFNIQAGDPVGIFAYNCYHWTVAQFACSRLGAILVPINPSYKSDELAFVLEQSGIKCLFMPGPKSVQATLNNHLKVLESDQILNLSASEKLKLRDIILLDSENDYTGKDTRLTKCTVHQWKELENDGIIFKSSYEAEQAGVGEHEACIYDCDQVSPDDTFAIYYTSGTTGKPKGACVSQFTAVNNALLCQRRVRNGRPLSHRLVASVTLPMFHIFAGVLNTLAPTLCNTTVTYTGHSYDIEIFVDSIIKNGANITSLTPTMLIDLLSYIETNNMANEFPLKIIQSGGAALSPEVAFRALKLLPNLEELRQGYGSTENGGVATLQSLHEPPETKQFTVGSPADFSEVRVVKLDTEELLPHGERGEIQTRGYNTMIEYLNQPEKTAEVISATRWYRTGDLGFMHPHGSIQICGRVKHMIIKGGENIYPEEVSRLIYQLEYVEDVHVIGVPDKRFGEQVCAWVKLKAGYREAKPDEKDGSVGSDGTIAVTKDAILEHCKNKITYFKVPRYLLFTNEFPMTPTKKVQYHIMTEMSCKILGIQVGK